MNTGLVWYSDPYLKGLLRGVQTHESSSLQITFSSNQREKYHISANQVCSSMFWNVSNFRLRYIILTTDCTHNPYFL